MGVTNEGSGTTRAPADSRLDRFATLVVLTVFGLTWPVIDLLGRNAEFFLARRAPKLEIVALAVLSLLAIPGLVGLLGSLPGRVMRWVGLILIAVLATSLANLYLSRLGVSWWLASTGAVIVGVGFTWAFTRFSMVRQLGRYLSFAPVVLLGVFLFTMPVGAVLREPDSVLGNPVPVSDPVPLVVVVLDEFPLASLIDSAGALRESRYPNFTRLADDGTWYRNAVTVQQQTEHSVPAILTGSDPDQSLIPVAGHYPFNMFTALRSSYDLYVNESITQLCPQQLCAGLSATASSLVRDVSVVAGHILLPEPATEDLPPIDRGWGDFASAAGDFDARGEFRALLRDGQQASIDRGLEQMATADVSHPALFYLHAIVPHHPWQFLPDGRSYPFIVSSNPASFGGGWIDDDFLVAQAMQRHLLQVGYADHVVGEVIATLEDRGIYDDAMVVVTADHGIAIVPGVDHQRAITPETVGEIASVPLFIKYPNGDGGVIDDRRALTIDILPTIADVIGADLPDDVEGVSLLGPTPSRDSTTTTGPEGAVTYGVDGAEKLEVARRIERWFPDGDPWALLPPGSPDILGIDVDTSSLESSDLRVRLRESDLYEDVDTGDEVVPARVGGWVFGGSADGDEVLAVVVNGEVGAVTRTFVDEGTTSFLAMIPPDLLVDGANTIDIVEVDGGSLLRVAG